MKITRMQLRNIISESFSETGQLRSQAKRDFASLEKSDVELINNYMTQISPELDLNLIFGQRDQEFIDVDKETVQRFEEARPQISEFLKMLTGNESQRITDYIESILSSLERHGTGNYTIRTFYKNGQPHSRGDNPAEIHRVSGGRVVARKWFKMGVEHREGDKPAIIQYARKYLKSKVYFKNGKLHRDGDKPAMILYMGENIPRIQEWYQDGLLHREGDKPCSIARDVFLGGEAAEINYCKTGLLHRDGDKPAVIVLDTSGNISLEIYYKKDMMHRDGDRPAKISYNKDGSVNKFIFALNGKEYTPEDPTWSDEYRGNYEKIN